MSTSPTAAPSFPGKVIRAGSAETASVQAIQKRLNQLGCGPVEEDGIFSAETLEAVMLFQARSADFDGNPLVIDGQVGPMTWAALFKSKPIGSAPAPVTTLAGRVLQVAAGEVGVTEQPPGSNRGPKVDRYLAAVGLNPKDGSFAWCAAFVYWCFREASSALTIPNPAVKTAGAVDTWNRAGTKGFRRITSAEAAENPPLVRPGMVFVLSTGGGRGHVGLVESVAGVVLTTIEGNTNEGGSREGIGVFRRAGRRISGINLGFVDYTTKF